MRSLYDKLLDSSYLGLPTFRGTLAFTRLLHDQEMILANIHREMKVLAEDLDTIKLPITLHAHCDNDTTASTARVRLRWRQRGMNARQRFEEIEPCISHFPAPVLEYFRESNDRAQELNTLESAFRPVVSQLRVYLKNIATRGD